MAGNPSRESRTGLLLIAFSAVVWGTIPLLIRGIGSMPVGVPFMDAPFNAAPVVIVFWRVCIASLAMLTYLALSGRLRSIVEVDRRTLVALAANGVLLAVHWILFFSALLLTDVAVAELLTYTGPIYVAALTPLVLKERFDARVLLPIALALAGMGIMLGPDIGSLQGSDSLLGASMAIVAAFGYAILMLNAKRLLRGLSPAVVMFWESVVAMLVLLPFVLLLPSFDGPGEWAAVLTLGLVHSGIVAFMFLSGLRHVRADHAAVLMYIEPVSAVIFAAMFLGEAVTFATLAGGTAVVVGGALVSRTARTPGVETPFAGTEESSPA